MSNFKDLLDFSKLVSTFSYIAVIFQRVKDCWGFIGIRKWNLVNK